MLFVLALGYGASKAKDFPADGTATVTELVLDFALPAGLFVRTVSVTRRAALGKAPLLLAFAIAATFTWAAVFVIAKLVFRHNTGEAGPQALVASFAAVPFYGLAALGIITHRQPG